MSHNIAFTVAKKSKNLYRLPLASTLLHFISFDFSYFIEQCAALTQKCMSSGTLESSESAVPKEYIRKCHPYFQILVHDDFDQITLDFSIDYICRTQKIGLEELWARNISSEQPFWAAVFARISSYKSGETINQWDNLLRMQEYAVSKLSFIYDGGLVDAMEYRMRKEYYDLAFSLTAEEMGFSPDEMPNIKYYSAALSPGSPVILGRLTGELSQRVRPATPERRHVRRPGTLCDAVHDQTAGMVVNAMIDLPRPGPFERVAALETCGSVPERIYIPSCFKAMLDLEFDQIIAHQIVLARSAESGLFEIIERGAAVPEPSVPEPPTPNFAPVGRETDEGDDMLFEGETEAAAPEPEEPETVEPAAVEPAFVESAFAAPAPERTYVSAPFKPLKPQEEEPQQDRLKQVQALAEDTNHTFASNHSTEDINVRCQIVQTKLHYKIARQERSPEFDQWARDLMQMRIRIVRKELSIDYLERFLDATEEVFELPADT